MNRIIHLVSTDDGDEIKVPIDFTYYYQEAKVSGPPEHCHPEEEEFEWEVDLRHEGFNALEWWAVQHIKENAILAACIDKDKADSDEAMIENAEMNSRWRF